MPGEHAPPRAEHALPRAVFTCGLALTLVTACAAPATAQDAGARERMELATVRVLVHAEIEDEWYTIGNGSGFIVGGQHVVTNAHVAAEPEAIARQVGKPVTDAAYSISLGGDEAIAATVVWRSVELDLAVLRPERDLGRPEVALVPSDLIARAQRVYAAGFPGAAAIPGGGAEAEMTLSEGIISKIFRDSGGRQLVQMTAGINPGNSGGPLFNECGEVLAVNSAGPALRVLVPDPDNPDQSKVVEVKSGDDIGWAIGVDHVRPALESLGIAYDLAGERCDLAAGMRQAVVIAAGRVTRAEATLDSLRATASVTQQQLDSARSKVEEEAALRRAAEERARSFQSFSVIGIGGTGLLALIALGLGLTRRGRTLVRSSYSKSRDFYSKSRDFVSRRVSRQLPPTPIQVRFRPVLRGLAGEFAGSTVDIGQTPLVIGRDPQVAQLVFPTTADDVSKRHCVIRFEPAAREFVLEDCWSTNGTYLHSGEAVRPDSPRRLKPGDRFYVSDPRHLFEVQLT